MAAQFYSAAYLNESILSCDEINKWAFVRHSIPVHIENVLYLFTEDYLIAPQSNLIANNFNEKNVKMMDIPCKSR